MKIYIIKNDVRLGPFTLEEAKQQGITAHTLVWHKGMPDWKVACSVPELADAIMPEAPTADYDTPPEPPTSEEQDYYTEPTPRPQEQPRRYAYAPDEDSQQGKSKKSKTATVTLIVALIVICIMMLTKPSRDEYVDTITERTTDYIIEQMSKNSDADAETLEGTVKYSTSKLVRGLIEQSIEVDDYFIFNKAKVKVGEFSLSVGFGMFGHVFTLDKDELAMIADKYIDKQRQKAPSVVRETIDTTIELGKQKAEELGIDSKAIDEALDSIKTKAEEKGTEVVDKVVEQAKEKGKQAINDIVNELNK